jgi:hypothetical protein
MNASSSDPRRGRQQVSTRAATCGTFAWCLEADRHTLGEHVSSTRAIAASGDPETYSYDVANGAVRVPLVMTYLTVPIDGHRAVEPPVVVLNVTDPGNRGDVDVSMTLREAAVLRDHLAGLIEEAQR